MLLFQLNVNLEKEMAIVVQRASHAMKEKETVIMIYSVLEPWFVAKIIVDYGIHMPKLAMIVVKDSLLVGFCFSCWCVSDPIQSTPSVSTNSLIIARPRSAPDIDMHPPTIICDSFSCEIEMELKTIVMELVVPPSHVTADPDIALQLFHRRLI